MNKSATNFASSQQQGQLTYIFLRFCQCGVFPLRQAPDMVNPQEFTSPAQNRISLIKPKASRTLLHIRLAFSRSLKAVVPKHVASSCFGTVRFKLCNKTKQCRRIKPFRVSLSRVISQTNFTEIQRVTVSRTRASTQDRLLSVRSLVFLPPPNYREKP